MRWSCPAWLAGRPSASGAAGVHPTPVCVHWYMMVSVSDGFDGFDGCSHARDEPGDEPGERRASRHWPAAWRESDSLVWGGVRACASDRAYSTFLGIYERLRCVCGAVVMGNALVSGSSLHRLVTRRSRFRTTNTNTVPRSSTLDLDPRHSILDL